MRITPLAVAAGLLFSGGAARAQAGGEAVPLAPIRSLQPPARGDAAQRLPIILRADELRGRPDLEAVAEGNVDFRRGDLSIAADRLSYELADDLAVARGHVRIEHEGAVYSGPMLQLKVQRFEGFFLEPEFEFTRLGAGGRADRVDFIDSARAVATKAIYTSCPRDGPEEPAWVLLTDRVRIDLDKNEGIADGAVLRFLGTPILAAPRLSFPLTDERKSGWLPPSIGLDSSSGLDLSVPYYWNIAPNRDATIAPRVLSRRGLGADAQFRYLEPAYNGTLDTSLLPYDRAADRARGTVQWQHDGQLRPELRYAADVVRVSDDAWWKDFPGSVRSPTPRLLSGRALVERSFDGGGGDGLLYARVQDWQVLQGSDQLVVAPYQRNPQIGGRWNGSFAGLAGGALETGIESEFNRFTLPAGDPVPGRLTGDRWHALGYVSHPWREPGWFVVPKLAFNAASYRTDRPFGDSDDRTSASRVIPTLSVDAGLEFQRQTRLFDRVVRQTLEPRVLYVDTPFVDQIGLPNFDAAAKDFNLNSMFSENAFSGVDRVSDGHQLTAGVTSRLIDERSGAEVMRLGVAQRYLLREQRIAPTPDGEVDGQLVDQRFSDILLFGSTTLVPHWTFDGSLQYSPQISRSMRSILGVRWAPGPFRTLSTTYRFTRGLSETVELGWQWPLRSPFARTPAEEAAEAGRSQMGTTAAKAGTCNGAWYSVGRVNYSMRDSRVTDSIIGFEYDAGCWIGRVVGERLSTGRSEATTRLLLQLELVGLSRIGSNPLRVLKDNIPGYRLLREDRRSPTPTDE